MKSMSAILKAVLFSFTLALFASCGSSSKDESKETNEKTVVTDISGAADTTTTESAKEVRITQKQYDAINVQLSSFEQKTLADVLKATGYLSVPPQNKASITSLLGGTVKSISVQEGTFVRKGQTLITVVNPEFVRMQQDYLDAKAQLSSAQANYTRQQELSKENVNSKKILQESEATYKSLLAKVNGLQSQFRLLGINAYSIGAGNIFSSFSVRSPINGTVAKVNINLGSTVDPSTPLMEVVDNSHLHLDLFVYEQDLPKVKIGQNIDFTLTNLPGKNFTATIYSVGSAFENETKTIPVHAEINGYKTELIEGMNVTGLINIGNASTTAVLSNAIASFSGVDYIFYQKRDSLHNSGSETEMVFERVRVKKGITSGGYTEITPLESVPGNAKIVTNGAFYLMAILTNAGEED